MNTVLSGLHQDDLKYMNGDFSEYIIFLDKKKSKKTPYDQQYFCRRKTTEIF